MEFYLRWPFIGLLAAISLALVTVSLITYVEFVGEEQRTYHVPANTFDFVIQETFMGIVKVRGEVPEGVKVYVLSYRQYQTYRESGELPHDFIGDGNEEIIVENPSYILIKNPLDEEARVELQFKIYRERKPYALLSIPSFFIMVAVTALASLRVFWTGKAMSSALS